MKTTLLPNTVLNLGPEIGYSLTKQGAQSVTSIIMRSFGPYKDENGKRKRNKEHYLDFNGADTILHRSPVITNAKRLRSLHRMATRRLGEFLVMA